MCANLTNFNIYFYTKHACITRKKVSSTICSIFETQSNEKGWNPCTTDFLHRRQLFKFH
jgi:hypothetical protein